jgi:hypothetical protein
MSPTKTQIIKMPLMKIDQVNGLHPRPDQSLGNVSKATVHTRLMIVYAFPSF